MKNIITKKELQYIQKYFYQIGGFGGILESGCYYESETGHGGRVGVIHIPDSGATVKFYKGSTIEELKADAQRRGIKWKISEEN